MEVLERLHATNYRKMREETIDPVLQSGEKVVAFASAEWFPKSKLIKYLGVSKELLQLTVGKHHVVCLTDTRFLLFELPKTLWTTSYSSAVLTLEVPRADIRLKSLGRKKLISRERELTLVLGPAAETTLHFRPPYTRDAETICAELQRA